MDFPNQSQTTLAAQILFTFCCSVVANSAEQPPSTPRPGTLAAYARTLELRRTLATDDTGRVTISNDNVQVIGSQTALIEGPSGDLVVASAPAAAEARTRALWRSRYLKQQQRVHEVERKKRQVEADIDLIQDGRLTPRSLARLARAEARLKEIGEELRRQRASLGRIVSEARQNGAQPGWFR